VLAVKRHVLIVAAWGLRYGAETSSDTALRRPQGAEEGDRKG